MVVPLRELPTTLDIELPSAFVREAIDGMPMRAALERPAEDPDAGAGRAHLELYSEDTNVFVRGSVEGWLEVACGRCLGTARIKVKEPLNITYLPKAQVPGDQAGLPGADAVEPSSAESDLDEELGAELADGDLDLYGYEGEEIDLAPMLREQFVLSVPLAPLCAEACKGLCPHCGVDRNLEACSCEPPLDPRLMALKDIKI